MPLYNFRCVSCAAEWKGLLKLEDVELKRSCTMCGGDLERAMQGPSTQVKEIFDNGIMSRRVELIKP